MAIFKADPADLVITDLVMPRMGGLDLLRALKDEGGLTIVLLTAQGSVETAVEAYEEAAACAPTSAHDTLVHTSIMCFPTGSSWNMS